MPGARVKAVCGSCRRQNDCQDAATLEQLRRFLVNSQLAAELALSDRRRYRLGCDRYQPVRLMKPPTRPSLGTAATGDGNTLCD